MIPKIYNTVQDSVILKNDLDILVLWIKEWLLPFNIDKCNILHFGLKKYNMEGKTYLSKSHNKGLGYNIWRWLFIWRTYK